MEEKKSCRPSSGKKRPEGCKGVNGADASPPRCTPTLGSQSEEKKKKSCRPSSGKKRPEGCKGVNGADVSPPPAPRTREVTEPRTARTSSVPPACSAKSTFMALLLTPPTSAVGARHSLPRAAEVPWCRAAELPSCRTRHRPSLWCRRRQFFSPHHIFSRPPSYYYNTTTTHI